MRSACRLQLLLRTRGLTRCVHAADVVLERMETNISAVLRHDTECIAAVHCLKVYCQRLGCDLADGAAVRRAAGCAFALATEALSDMAVLQFPPSLTAAAILVAARRAQARTALLPPLSSLCASVCASAMSMACGLHRALSAVPSCCSRNCQSPLWTVSCCGCIAHCCSEKHALRACVLEGWVKGCVERRRGQCPSGRRCCRS
jgi:hypothetical protein